MDAEIPKVPPHDILISPKPETSLATRLLEVRRSFDASNKADGRHSRALERFKEMYGITDFHRDSYRQAENDAFLAPFREEREQANAHFKKTALGLVADYTDSLPGVEGLEVRQVPARLDTPTCYEVPLQDKVLFPEGRHHADQGFNTAFIPWKPSQEDLAYFSHPENLTQIELNPLDVKVREIIEPILQQNGMDFEVWLNWSLSKKILGTEMFAADFRSESVTRLLRRYRSAKGEILRRSENRSDEAKSTYIPLPEDFAQLRDRVRKTVCWDNEDNISDAYKLVSLARWDREKKLDLYPNLSQQLPSLYTDFLAALEVNYPHGERARFKNFRIAQAYPTLVMGGRQEQHYLETFMTPWGGTPLDYFDAFMLCAAELKFDKFSYAKTDKEKDYLFRKTQRCLFGSHNLVNSSPGDILLTMATMYFRMNEGDKALYADVIESEFQKINEGPNSYTSQYRNNRLVVPGTNAESEPKRNNYDHREDIRPALSVAQERHRLIVYPMLAGKQHLFTGFHTDRDLAPKFEVYARHYDWNTHGGHVPDNIEGHCADKFRVDENGFLVFTGDKEEFSPERIPVSLTVKERRGEEAAKLVETILQKPEDGNLDRLASVKTMLEMITGCNLAGNDLYDTLVWLGGIQEQAGVIRDAPRGEIERILESCHRIPDFNSTDRLSQLMAIYTAFGFLPKELVVERVLESAQAAGSLFTVRFALMLENMRKKDLSDRGIDVADYVSPVFSAREEIKKANAMFERKEITDNRYRLIVQHNLAEILNHFNTYCSYDWTMTSALGALLVSEKTGSLYAQCGAQAEIMADFANFVTPEPCAYTSFREIDTDIPVDEWLSIIALEPHVSHDHLMAQVDFGFGKDLQVFVMDQNSAHILLTNKVETDEKRTGATTNSRVDRYPRLRRTEFTDTPSWTGINYGARDKGKTSTMLAHLTINFPLLSRYADTFNPDDIMTLNATASNPDYPRTERLDVLHKLIQVAPRVFGRHQEAHQASIFVRKLNNCIELATESADYIPALFLTNILSLHCAVPNDIKIQAERMRFTLLSAVAMRDTSLIESGLTYYKEIMTEKDREDIRRASDKYQTELQKAKEKGREDEFRRTTANKIRTVFFKIKDKVQDKADKIKDEDKLKDTLGGVTKRAVRAVDNKNQSALVELNQDGLVDFGDGVHLIGVHSDVSQKALAGILQGVPQKMIPNRLLGLEVILLKSERAFFGSHTNLIAEAWQRLEDAARNYGHQLPYTREELRRGLKDILVKHKLDSGDPVAGLLN